jgi:hypothetical protein
MKMERPLRELPSHALANAGDMQQLSYSYQLVLSQQ